MTPSDLESQPRPVSAIPDQEACGGRGRARPKVGSDHRKARGAVGEAATSRARLACLNCRSARQRCDRREPWWVIRESTLFVDSTMC